jgi:hypothetical protein
MVPLPMEPSYDHGPVTTRLHRHGTEKRDSQGDWSLANPKQMPAKKSDTIPGCQSCWPGSKECRRGLPNLALILCGKICKEGGMYMPRRGACICQGGGHVYAKPNLSGSGFFLNKNLPRKPNEEGEWGDLILEEAQTA